MNEGLTDYYIRYFTLVIFLVGFIYGSLQVFSILASYDASAKFTYDKICSEEFGRSYSFNSFNGGEITCKKESTKRFTIKKKVYLGFND